MAMTVSSDAAHPHVVWTIPNYQYECNGEDELVQNVFIEKSEMTGWLSSDRQAVYKQVAVRCARTTESDKGIPKFEVLGTDREN